jgi:putative FmdB family regulatory protein
MPTYEYACRTCGVRFLDGNVALAGTPCPKCKVGALRKLFSFAFKRPMQEHFNQSTGQFVSNERDFKEQLKIKSAEDGERLGLEVNYQPVDVRDTAALGVTAEGLDPRKADALGLS